jgi:hypothetical protein
MSQTHVSDRMVIGMLEYKGTKSNLSKTVYRSVVSSSWKTLSALERPIVQSGIRKYSYYAN